MNSHGHQHGGVFHGSRFPYAAISAARQQQNAALVALRKSGTDESSSLLLQAIVTPGDQTPEGRLVDSVAVAWFEIVKEIKRNSGFIDQLDWRMFEELVAGAYDQAGFKVILTPRSHDRGRDVIAVKEGFGSVRFVDQVKKYAPGHVVPANDVRALVGVLNNEANTSKAVLTTTSTFAPGVYTEFEAMIPYRLQLKDRPELLKWLESLLKE